MSALEKIKQCLADEQDFVLQGGAGSGKTETLKEVLSYISLSEPNMSVACITLTNKAADEIRGRVGDRYHISTIHSFLHSQIDKYRESIRSVLGVVFELEPLACSIDIKNEIDHNAYKKHYSKYAKALYRLNNVKAEKCVLKKEYDKDCRSFVLKLSQAVLELNTQIFAAIAQCDLRKIQYNESSFDNIRTFSYGHSGLLKVSATLIRRFTVLQRILGDKFDYIFVDEYQDTSPEIVDVLIEILAKNTRTTIGFFGDSMQGIYEGGIGDVERFVASGNLRKIEKEDNYRCSTQVVKFLNSLRLDTLKQEVAMKRLPDGEMETAADREGAVNFYYSIAPEGAAADKVQYVAKLRALIGRAENDGGTKYLMLTNKSIAGEVGFATIYDVFTDRFGQERGEEMERILTLLQFDELTRLCTLFKRGQFNELISAAKKGGFTLSSNADKIRLYHEVESLVASNASAIAVLNAAFGSQIISPSEAYLAYMDYRQEFLSDLKSDASFQIFMEDCSIGINTCLRMIAAGREMDEFRFEDMKRSLRKKIFFEEFFSDRINFTEIVNYFDYLNDEKSFVTMHKTKGTGISNVIVVLNEYFWPKYNFQNILTANMRVDQVSDRKVVYVACSRAINKLACVRLISASEESALLNLEFSSVKKFDYSDL